MPITKSSSPRLAHEALPRLTASNQIQLSQLSCQVARTLVAHAEARAVRKHARRNVHGEEFLEEQLGRVGDVDLRDAGLVVAGAAFVAAFFDGAGVALARVL
jgi:hypothetical protein